LTDGCASAGALLLRSAINETSWILVKESAADRRLCYPDGVLRRRTIATPPAIIAPPRTMTNVTPSQNVPHE
jgi:hypothetical protein